MKFIRLIFIAMMAVSANSQEPVSDEKQILKLEDDWVRAMVTRDRSVLDKIIGPGFTFIEPDGTIKDRKAYLADRTSENVHTEAFKNTELKVRILGNFAIASGLATMTEQRRDGKRYRFSLRWKEMWMKQNGQWQVVASQATPVNPSWDAGFVIKN